MQSIRWEMATAVAAPATNVIVGIILQCRFVSIEFAKTNASVVGSLVFFLR